MRTSPALVRASRANITDVANGAAIAAAAATTIGNAVPAAAVAISRRDARAAVTTTVAAATTDSTINWIAVVALIGASITFVTTSTAVDTAAAVLRPVEQR